MVTYLRNRFSMLDIHTMEVLKKSSASLFVKVIGMTVGLLVSIFLGRAIGAEGLGIINLSNQIISLLLVVTMFGMNNVLLKNIAIAYNNQNWQHISNNIYTSSIFNGTLALIISVIGILLAPFIVRHVFHEEELKVPLLIALAMIVPQTFSRIYASGLNGFKKIWQSNLVNETLSAWIVGGGLVLLLVLDIPVNVINVAILYGIGRLVVTFSIGIYWKKLFHFQGKKQWIVKPMLKMAMPLFLVSATGVVASNADIIMLGWLSSTREVGLYSVAARLALLVSFLLQVTNSAISPKLAALYANGEQKEMRIMVKRVTSVLILIAFTSLVVFIFGGNYILGLWGNEFEDAYMVLIILGIGQFFNISTGCAGLLLIMCGYEKIQGYISISSVILNLTLNYFLIRTYGAIGAASATAITVGGENILKMIMAKRKVGISTMPLMINLKKKHIQ